MEDAQVVYEEQLDNLYTYYAPELPKVTSWVWNPVKKCWEPVYATT